VKEYRDSESGKYQLLLRPEHVQISGNGIEALVTKVFYTAGQKYINCKVGSLKDLTVLTDSGITVGESVHLAVDIDSIEVLVA
jgi:hypothetical protein